ncbi:MAG: hypothetical protein OET79_12580 [Nitrospirota bacterium]|nr:hypothetical protein [Nitrospirota bacterium]
MVPSPRRLPHTIFNRRRSHARGLLFHRLAQQAVAVGPAPYHQIIATSDTAPALGAT